MRYQTQHQVFHLMPSISCHIRCLLMFCMLASGASARTCRILFIDRPADAPKTLHLFDGEKIRQVELPGLNLSPVYQLPDGNLNLRFFRNPPADLKNLPESAPSVRIAEELTDVYLIMGSNPKNVVAPIHIQVVSADSANVSRGQMLWFNLTDKRVGGKVGTEKLDLKPLGSVRVAEPRQGTGDYPVELYFVIEGDAHLHPLCESQWQHDPRSRSLVFIARNGNRRAPRIYSVSDFRVADKREIE